MPRNGNRKTRPSEKFLYDCLLCNSCKNNKIDAVRKHCKRTHPNKTGKWQRTGDSTVHRTSVFSVFDMRTTVIDNCDNNANDTNSRNVQSMDVDNEEQNETRTPGVHSVC